MIPEGVTILGIDLGPNSLGWALLNGDESGPKKIHAMGVRVFDAGLDELEKDGKGKSRNAQRRESRSTRRRLERHTRRIVKIANILRRSGLMPDGDMTDSMSRHEILNRLDKSISSPYSLRARALDEKLEPHELGRAFYHICQRRGFLSNRKEGGKKKDDDKGKVKEGIKSLNDHMKESGARTLGEYFSKINPHEERIRTRYTSRAMYEQEFYSIWESQRNFHPGVLTDELKKEIHHAIFHQRPLKSQAHLIGDCELEPGRKRAPWALLEAQQYRYLQKVNDLMVDDGNGMRELSVEERKNLIGAMERNASLKFTEIKKLLGLKKTRFNLESGGEERLPGNETAAKLRDVFGDKWDSMTEDDHRKVVEDMWSIQNNNALAKVGIKRWGLDENAAKEFAEISLPEGYCSYSKQALLKILPLLKRGVQLNTAVRELYPDRWARQTEPMGLLPPVKSDELPDLRNPIVERSLTELRKVVNAIIKEYGKPDYIHIELARELRQNAKQRGKSTETMRNREKDRKKAAEKLLKECGITKPSRADIEKVLLAEECGWHCPYTGKGFSTCDLVGDHPKLDIEHIIPFERSLDNSFMNKTLCMAEENRNVKKGKTPYEAYHGTDKWKDMIGRVKEFKNDEKLRRFMMDENEAKEFIDGFTSRQLNDTRYATKRAKEYLGLLYGGTNDDGIDHEGTRRVLAATGQVTAFLRNAWNLNPILGDGPGKSRDDHRHHAVDALVIALADQKWVKALSDAAKRAPKERKRLFGRVEDPWPGFLDEARQKVMAVIPSRRVSRRVRGALHEETFYGKPRADRDGKTYTHVRKPIEKISRNDVDDIVDKAVREAVSKKIEEVSGEPKNIFKDKKDHPLLTLGNGKRVPIHYVTIRKSFVTFYSVGSGHGVRHVQSDSNHHMEIVEDIETGQWDGHVVSMYEAHRRMTLKKPVVIRDHGLKKRFVFSLSGGEIIDMHNSNGVKELFVISSIWEEKGKARIQFKPLHDARTLKDIGKVGLTAFPRGLHDKQCEKKAVSPLGEIFNASD